LTTVSCDDKVIVEPQQCCLGAMEFLVGRLMWRHHIVLVKKLLRLRPLDCPVTLDSNGRLETGLKFFVDWHPGCVFKQRKNGGMSILSWKAAHRQGLVAEDSYKR